MFGLISIYFAIKKIKHNLLQTIKSTLRRCVMIFINLISRAVKKYCYYLLKLILNFFHYFLYGKCYFLHSYAIFLNSKVNFDNKIQRNSACSKNSKNLKLTRIQNYIKYNLISSAFSSTNIFIVVLEYFYLSYTRHKYIKYIKMKLKLFLMLSQN